MNATAHIERIDHLGVVAGVIKDLGLVDLSNQRIGMDVREDISIGEAFAGMTHEPSLLD